MSEVGVAVVGCGGMGTHHCIKISETEGLRLVAVCDISKQCRDQEVKNHGVKGYAAVDDLLKDDAVEMVVFVTPHHTHATLTIQALSSGRHVVVEKAMCLNVKEADAMIAAADKAGRTLTVFQNRRMDNDYLTAKQVLDSGVLGDVYRIEAAINYHGPQDGWRTQMKYGGGYLYDGGGHLIDQLVQLAGSRAKTVFADLQKRLWTDNMDTETYANVNVRFENGLVGELDISGIMWYRKERFVIMGEKGTFVALAHDNFGEADCFVYTETDGSTTKSEVKLVDTGNLLAGMAGFYKELSNHLLHKGPLLVEPKNVRESIKIIEAAYRSAETGQSVDVLDW